MINYLDHLSPNQLRSLINDYYGDLPTKEIKEKYNLAYTGTSINKILPKRELEVICPYCDQFMYGEYPPKSRADDGFENISCRECGHKHDIICHCDNCKEKAKEEKARMEEKKRKDIRKFTNSWPQNTNHYLNLDLKDKVILGALLRDCSTEDFDRIHSINSNRYKLAPTIAFSLEAIKHLKTESNAISIHSDSPLSSIEDIDVNAGSFSYYPASVNYYMNVSYDEMSKIEVANLLMNPPLLDEFELEEGLELWKEIAYQESIEFLLDTAQTLFGVDFKIGEKTQITIEELLTTYSTSQVYAIIYYAGTKASRFKMEQNVSNQHAANYIVGACRSYSERAVSNGWEIQKYHRRKHMPQSSISKFLYERVLGIGDLGFYSKPDQSLIKFQPFDIDLDSEIGPDDESIPF